jgi:hypothetical protein
VGSAAAYEVLSLKHYTPGVVDADTSKLSEGGM